MPAAAAASATYCPAASPAASRSSGDDSSATSSGMTEAATTCHSGCGLGPLDVGLQIIGINAQEPATQADGQQFAAGDQGADRARRHAQPARDLGDAQVFAA